MTKKHPNPLLSDQQIIILDTETTGVESDAEILQISMIDKYENVLFDGYFKPKFHNSWDKAMEINHITPDFVKYKPQLEHYRLQLETLINNADMIIGFNIPFDLNMLRVNGIDIPAPPYKIGDPMVMYIDLFGERISLKKMCEKFGYKGENDRLHNSLEDCKATLFCYKEMLKQFEKNDLKN